MSTKQRKIVKNTNNKISKKRGWKFNFDQKHKSEKSTEYYIECSNVNCVDSDTFYNLRDRRKSRQNECNLCEGLAKWAIQFQMSFVAITTLSYYYCCLNTI